MPQSHRDDFRQAVLTCDKVFGFDTRAVRSAADNANTMDGAARLAELQASRVSCQVPWCKQVRLQRLTHEDSPPAIGHGGTRHRELVKI